MRIHGDVGRSAVWSRYKSGRNALPWGTPAVQNSLTQHLHGSFGYGGRDLGEGNS
jgi:hypothetical protein